MSEGRQLVLLLVGLLALTAFGVFGATLFPEPCDDLEQPGELSLEFTDAVDALPLSDEDAAAVEAAGTELGIGPWRGAVALPASAQVTSSDFGFFVVTDEAFTVLRPSMGLASAARGRGEVRVLPAGTSLALRAGDGVTGVYNSEYELDRCGELPTDADVLALSAGLAVTTSGGDVTLVTLSGDERWQAPAASAAHFAGGAVVLATDGVLELRDVRDGALLDELTDLPAAGPVPRPEPPPWVDATADRLLLPAPGGVLPVSISSDELEAAERIELPLGPDPVGAAVSTPAGIVASGRAGQGIPGPALATDRSDTPVLLPPTLRVVGLHASVDGHVGVLVEVEDQQALLVYGRDIDE